MSKSKHSRRSIAADRRRVYKRRRVSDKEVAEKGWSAWELQAYGADHLLLPRMGTALIDAGYAYSGTLLKNIDKLEDYTNGWSNVKRISEKAFRQGTLNALGLHPDVVRNLRNSVDPAHYGRVRRNPVVCLGEAIVDWVDNYEVHGAPNGYGVDNSSIEDPWDYKTDFEAWANDLKKYGLILANVATASDSEIEEAFVFLSKYCFDLWD